VYQYLCWVTQEEALAADLTAEAFLRIWKHPPDPRRRGSLRAYVFTVAVNELRRHRQRHGVELVQLEDLEEPPTSSAEDPPLVAERRELCRLVQAAVGKLPEIHRAVILLHNFQGFTLREVAEMLGVPVGTAKSRLATAFVALRRLLHELRDEPDELR
jgi:RNA polymerase sigma-70 factor (ECF subfamily)